MADVKDSTKLTVEHAKQRILDLLGSGGYAGNIVGHTVHYGYKLKVGRVTVIIESDEVTMPTLDDDDWRAFLTCLGDHTNG